MSFRVVVDRNLCAGTSNCVEEAPEVYEMGADGLAVGRQGVHALEALMRGAEACPVQAIRIIEEETGRIVYP